MNIFRCKSGEGFLLSTFVLLILSSIMLSIYGMSIVPRLSSHSLGQTMAPSSQLEFIFSESMDKASVEQGFSIVPNVEGSLSWAGRRMVFTPQQGFNTNTQYLVGFSDMSGEGGREGNPVSFDFFVPEQRVFFVSSEEETEWRLVSMGLDTEEIVVHTPAHLLVTDFQPVLQDGVVFFMGVDKQNFNSGRLLSDQQELYRLNISDNSYEKIASTDGFLNYDFSVIPGEDLMFMYRIKISPNKDYEGGGLYVRRGNEQWKPFWNKTLLQGNVETTKDGSWIFSRSVYEMILLPLEGSNSEVQVLGNYMSVLDMGRNDQEVLLHSFSDSGHVLSMIRSGGGRKEIYSSLLPVNDAHFRPFTSDVYFAGQEVSDEVFSLLRYNGQEDKVVKLDLGEEGSIGEMDISSTGDSVVLEMVEESRYGYVNEMRDDFEDSEYTLAPSRLIILNLEDRTKRELPMRGRKPAFAW